MKKVAVIDDDPVYFFAVKKSIEIFDKEIECVNYPNGYEAYYAITEAMANGSELPHTLILDIEMPVMDGWDFLKLFGSLGKMPVNVVVASAGLHPSQKPTLRKLCEIADILDKPVSIESIKKYL